MRALVRTFLREGPPPHPRWPASPILHPCRRYRCRRGHHCQRARRVALRAIGCGGFEDEGGAPPVAALEAEGEGVGLAVWLIEWVEWGGCVSGGLRHRTNPYRSSCAWLTRGRPAPAGPPPRRARAGPAARIGTRRAAPQSRGGRPPWLLLRLRRMLRRRSPFAARGGGGVAAGRLVVGCGRCPARLLLVWRVLWFVGGDEIEMLHARFRATMQALADRLQADADPAPNPGGGRTAEAERGWLASIRMHRSVGRTGGFGSIEIAAAKRHGRDLEEALAETVLAMLHPSLTHACCFGLCSQHRNKH